MARHIGARSDGDPNERVGDPRPRLVLIAGTDLVHGRQSTGGHPSYVKAHALAAVRLGFEPHIFSIMHRKAAPERTDFGVLHRVATPVRPLRAHMAQAHSLFLARAVTEFLGAGSEQRSGGERPALARGGLSLIHGFGAWSLAGVLAARSLARRGIEAVAIASAYTTLQHESAGKLAGVRPRMGRAALEYPVTDAWIRLVGARAESYALRRSKPILVNYDSVRRLLEDSFGTGLPIERIPYASALAFASSPATSDDRPEMLERLSPADGPLIVSISRHDPRKGIDVLLQALAGLAHEQVPFRACLVGPGPLLASNRAYASRLGLDGRVAIPGRVDDVAPYLRAADVFVLPSLEEGSGSVSLLEALQVGVPVVASRLDGIPEDLRAGTDAALVEPGDPHALQDALARLLRDADVRAVLAVRSRALYEERFSADAFTAALGDVYARAGASAARASPAAARTSAAT
jgi:glycosyltransferase involved in cell wall biosynthesis